MANTHTNVGLRYTAARNIHAKRRISGGDGLGNAQFWESGPKVEVRVFSRRSSDKSAAYQRTTDIILTPKVRDLSRQDYRCDTTGKEYAPVVPAPLTGLD